MKNLSKAMQTSNVIPNKQDKHRAEVCPCVQSLFKLFILLRIVRKLYRIKEGGEILKCANFSKHAADFHGMTQVTDS